MPNNWSENGKTLVSYLEHEAHEDVFEILRKLWTRRLHPPGRLLRPEPGHEGQVRQRLQPTGPRTRSAAGRATCRPRSTRRPGSRSSRRRSTTARDRAGSGWARPTIGFTAISKKSEARVETLLAYLNFLAAPFGTQEYLFRKFGLPGIHHTVVDGNPVLTDKRFQRDPARADVPGRRARGRSSCRRSEGNSEAEFNAMKQICPDRAAPTRSPACTPRPTSARARS